MRGKTNSILQNTNMGLRRSETEVRSGGDFEGARDQIMTELGGLLGTDRIREANRVHTQEGWGMLP